MYTIVPDQLHNAMLLLIMQHPEVKMKDLQALLSSEYNLQYTQQNLYRVIGRMIEKGMVVKNKGKLSLDLHWIAYLKRFSQETIMKIADHANTAVDLPLEEGEKKEYVAESLKTLTPVWDSVLISLIEFTKATEIAEYVSHPYWTLCRSNLPDKFNSFNTQKGTTYKTIVGCNTLLDKHGLALLGTQDYRKCIMSEKTGLQPHGYKLEVIGDFVVELQLPPKLTHHFEFMFDSIKDLKRFDDDIFYDIFALGIQCSFTVTKNKVEADRLRQVILKEF